MAGQPIGRTLVVEQIGSARDRVLRRPHATGGVFSGPLVRLYIMQRKFLVQIFALKKESSDQYRSVIFPADRAMEGALFCEKWHLDESEVVPVLKQILPGTADVAQVLGQAQSIEGCLMELELTDSEATLLGWRPELLDD
jgi:hypothetical protein